MPMIDLTVPEGTLGPEAKRELPAQMAAALLRWEGAPDNEFFRSISWLHLHELPADAVHTADGPAEPHAVVQVTTPEGALSDRRRTGLVEELTRLVLEATGWDGDARLRVWILCREIDEGSWGAGGEIVRFEQLRAMGKAALEGAEAPA